MSHPKRIRITNALSSNFTTGREYPFLGWDGTCPILPSELDHKDRETVCSSSWEVAEYESATENMQVRCTESRSKQFKEGKVYDVIRFESGSPVCMGEHGHEVRFRRSKWEPVEEPDRPNRVRVTEARSSVFITGKEYEVLEWSGNSPVMQNERGYSSICDVSEWEAVEEEADTEKPVAYISGPMTGYPDHNRDRFYEVEEIVRAMGYDVVNPARLDREGDADDTWTHQDYMRRDVKAAIDCDVFIVFDEWQNSKGATDEAYLATSCGIPLRELDSTDTLTDSAVRAMCAVEGYEAVDGYPEKMFRLNDDVNLPVALEGKQLVLGGRRRDYGHPKENFERIALLWEAWMKATGKLAPGASIDIRDVGHMMIQVKQARDVNTPKRDNQVDIVGYAYALQESYEQREREGESMDDFLSTEALQLRSNFADGAFRTTKEGHS